MEVVGSDHLAQMNVVLPVTCVGPLDPITVLVNISPNPDWLSKARKIRVNKLQVKWTISCTDSEDIHRGSSIIQGSRSCHEEKANTSQ
jgi:hypothetical protein